MEVKIDSGSGAYIAVINSAEILIADAQDALELMATVTGLYETNVIVLNKSAFAESFFDLKTGIAGEVLLKFSNYDFKVAIVGDFESCGSQSLKDFIYESNRGNQFFFLPTEEVALHKLHSVFGQ